MTGTTEVRRGRKRCWYACLTDLPRATSLVWFVSFWAFLWVCKETEESGIPFIFSKPSSLRLKIIFNFTMECFIYNQVESESSNISQRLYVCLSFYLSVSPNSSLAHQVFYSLFQFYWTLSNTVAISSKHLEIHLTIALNSMQTTNVF